MKPTKLLALGAAATLLWLTCGCSSHNEDSDHLIILHTNDTHSAIDPDRHDKGGVSRRKVLIDSVKGVHENVMLVDAGDAVQGSLYYTLFGGEVERKVMNALGYDIQILGNHEFDKGMEQLAKEWKQLNANRLSTNYDFTGSTLEGLFAPALVKKVGDKTVGFIAINLDPAGIVTEANYEGVKYIDGIKAANEEAANLKKDGIDMVIAITHIGYDGEQGYSDVDIARNSHDIDVIIGGHSHTVIDPADNRQGIPSWRVANADGDTISVLQTGSSGVNLGEIDINLRTKEVKARLIPVDSRLDDRAGTAIENIIAPYRKKVEEMRSKEIGKTPVEYERKSPEMVNLLSDFVRLRGAELCGKPVDLSIMNKGGIRNSLPAGTITQGAVIDIAPFDNSIVVMDIKGSDLLDNIAIMAAQDGQGVSSNVNVLYDPTTKEINSATVDGRNIDPAKTYRLATIDYLAAGNDYMEPLSRGTVIAKSPEVLYQILIDYISSGKLDKLLANPDSEKRMRSF
ncbi:MAG: bifunctional metallophosphatase/5'-nucleotidase [Staphylococcus sp.]|nr:bifunctional metallophosphatase/5'-nucleotidase [Staphylococcus sp.]